MEQIVTGLGDFAMLKTITFDTIHIAVAFTVTYLITGDVVIGSAVAIVEPMVNTVAYFFHEKAWGLVRAHGTLT